MADVTKPETDDASEASAHVDAPAPPVIHNPIETIEAIAASEQDSVVLHPEWYFDGKRFFFKLLRALNILEPDRVVISLTKIMLWGATIQSILVVSTSSDWLTVTGALGMNIATMLKHESRRRQQGAVTHDGE